MTIREKLDSSERNFVDGITYELAVVADMLSDVVEPCFQDTTRPDNPEKWAIENHGKLHAVVRAMRILVDDAHGKMLDEV